MKAVGSTDRTAQPALIVNDLKLGDRKGAVASWIGLGTEALLCRFTSLELTQGAHIPQSAGYPRVREKGLR